MKNPSLELTLRLLAHPLSWLACTLLLLNDLLLKQYFPSFLTGKLSDLSGLFLLPFLVGAIISLFSPLLKLSDRFIRIFSLILPGVIFTFAKCSPAAAQFLNHKLAMRIVPDFSDLLALPVLAGSAWLWHSLAARPATHRAWQSLALPVILLATLGDMAAPDYGISCLLSDKGVLFASNMLNQHYTSTDGGSSWHNDTSGKYPVCQYGALQELPVQINDPARSTSYRIASRTLVEISTDGGASWKAEPLRANVTEAEWQYLRMAGTSSPILEQGILATVLDPATGNLVLALGHQGVLVRAPSGTYTWVDVGQYRHRSLARAGFEGFAALLMLPFLFSLLVSFLAMRVWALKRDHTRWQVFFTVLAWILLILFGLSIIPGVIPYQSLASTISGILFAVTALYLLSMDIIAYTRMDAEVRWWARLIPRALLIGLVSFLFFVAWYLNWIPSYLLAAFLSLAWVIFAISYLSARIPDKIQV